MFRITHPARSAAVIAAVAISALTLSACSGSSGSGGSGAAVDTSKLTIGIQADMAPNGYDPLRYSTGQRIFFEGMYDSLFMLNNDGKTVPDLVKKFSYNADNTQMTLDLKTNVKFTDGSELTADLVKKNLDYRSQAGALGLNAYTQFGAGQTTEIKDVTVVDDHTVTLTFASAQPAFQANLAFPSGAIVGASGVADRSSLDTKPDGSGPFVLDKSGTVKGNKYLLTKKKGDAQAKAYPFNSYEFLPIVDPQARVNSVISGQSDVAEVTADTQAQLKSSGASAGVELVANGGTIFNLIAFDKVGATGPQWSDPRVYQALSMAINRKEYVKGVHPGEVPTTNALPAKSPGYLPALNKQFAYDPVGAKKLLAEAGYANGFTFDFTVTPGSQRDIEALAAYWKAIGVTVTITNASSTEQQFKAVQTNALGGPLALTWDNPAGNIFGVLFGFANYHNAKNPAIQGAAGAYSAAAAKADVAAQKTALADLNKAIVESGWLIPLYEALSPWGYNTKKVTKLTFPGSDPYPLLASIKPAS
ncbi:MAG TPA: ABC transporter substrate-binding protein [Microbacteriaceae bacterium]|jgi:peptide/nickel transport system substrate-binding protein|nr:ABC transporter substrate-binding protein [Microbacteriaceae bacterium]